MKFLLLLSFLVSSAAWGSPYGFNKGSFAIKADTSYLYSSKNFSDSGALTSISQQNSITETKLDLCLAYDLSNTWGLYAKTSFKNFNSQTSTYNLSVLGFSDLSLGSDFLIGRWGNLKAIADFSALIPFAGEPGHDRTAFYSDGAYYLSGKSYLNYNISHFKNLFYAGATWRSQGLSTQIPLGIQSRFFFIPKAFISATVEGELSLSNDQYTSAPSQRYIINQAFNAGSQIYNAVNPQFAALKLEAGGLMFSNITLSAGINYVFWGQRVADELRYFITFGYQTKLASEKKFEADDPDKFEVDTED